MIDVTNGPTLTFDALGDAHVIGRERAKEGTAMTTLQMIYATALAKCWETDRRLFLRAWAVKRYGYAAERAIYNDVRMMLR